MAKADRLARLDDRRIEAETEYHTLLHDALQRTAAGQLRLFGHGKDKAQLAKAAPTIAELTELGESVDSLRDQLSLEPFALHARFLASRGAVSAHAVGEAKQAQAWLDHWTETPA
ncbi:hypothetical protein [Sphingomonas sp. PAMC 26605]|uniref:hypothetical protein n=1 Tax=Sphingomonas sp. PAMC 26605 TaxID=1112214 RepID=UPI00026CDDF5|nr:hypothetical protein [Sphingomonas sp. PAMC 26605]